jgi:SAM-dependent methyltransferase
MVHSFLEREQCPVCRSRKSESFYRSRFDEGPVARYIETALQKSPAILGDANYELVRCRACTLIYQRWVGDEALLTELYGEWIDDLNHPRKDPQYQAEVLHFTESRDGHEILTAAAFLRLRPEAMLTLDYGMGWAMWARIARQLGCISYGSDLSPSRMDFAAEHDVVPIADEDIPPATFHFINTEQVMEHLPDPRGTAERLARALVPGGILKVSVPSGKRTETLLARLNRNAPIAIPEELVPVAPLEHVNCFTGRALEVLAQDLGLEIVRPPISKRYAFLAHHRSVSLKRPKKALKELVRPFFTFNNPANLYVWMRKPEAPALVSNAGRAAACGSA